MDIGAQSYLGVAISSIAFWKALARSVNLGSSGSIIMQLIPDPFTHRPQPHFPFRSGTWPAVWEKPVGDTAKIAISRRRTKPQLLKIRFTIGVLSITNVPP